MRNAESLLLVWKRSSACGSDACVEVAMAEGAYYVRDSKAPNGPTLRFTQDEWNAFSIGMVAGEFVFD